LLISILLLISQGRHLFFTQERAGFNGKKFKIYKFRTLKEEGIRNKNLPIARNIEGKETKLGKYLRDSKIDELPQLINVLKGEMSLVGPRPLPVNDIEHTEWLDHYDEEKREIYLDWLKNRTTVPQGLTGKWQISNRPDSDLDNWVTCDNWYLEHRNLFVDLVILIKTPLKIFFPF